MAIDKGIEAHLEEYVAELETLLRHRDMRGLYNHLKMTGGPGREENRGTAGHQGRERQSAVK